MNPALQHDAPAEPGARAARRRLWFGLLTVLGVAPRGFFIPYRHAGAILPPQARQPFAEVEALLAQSVGQFREVLGWVDGHGAELQRLGGEPAPAPRWDQAWFPRLDAAVAYTLVRRIAPRRIVEVGSGHSTRFLARAVADGKLGTRIVAIDPAPRAVLEGLGVELRRATVQEVGSRPFAGLAANDVLAVDSSHILMPGSDVEFLLGRIIPALPSGALLQVHDVFLPDDYPAAWAWRGYNEQLGILPLLFGGAWEIVFASHYVATRMADAVAASSAARLPLAPGAIESSFWLRRR